MATNGHRYRISIHPSRGGGTQMGWHSHWNHPISIHPPRGGRDPGELHIQIFIGISIHPPRGGRDPPGRSERAPGWYFNPPAPWGAGRAFPRSNKSNSKFQSTRPVGGGTTARTRSCNGSSNFNPPAPCGAGQWAQQMTALREGFQSTRPVGGGGTRDMATNGRRYRISIHPPRGGGTRDMATNGRRYRISIHPSRRIMSSNTLK